jgi:glucokinase
LILCVDIGGTSTKAGLVALGGTVTHLDSIPTQPEPDCFLDNLERLISETRDKAGVELSHLGIAIAGFLDDNRSCLAYNPNIPWLEHYPIREKLQQCFPTFEIELEVDSNAATMAEYRFGSGQGASRFLCLTSGTGLGVGMTIAGTPLRFAYGCMGDIGHTVVLRDGPLCACGGRGCAEALVSSATLAKTYRSLIHADYEISLRNVIEDAKSGQPEAISVLQQAGEWLGVAVASMANTFFPDHIAIAGGLSAAGEVVLKPAERVFRETACELATRATFAKATLGSTATLIGAAWPFWRQTEFPH